MKESAIVADVLDPEHEAHLAEHARDFPGEPWIRTPCADAGRHEWAVEGMRLYLARRTAGLTQPTVVRELGDRGVACTVERLAAWEHELSPVTVEALHALARLFGVHVADLVLCWECVSAAFPEHFRGVRVPADVRFDGERIKAARRAHSLSRRKAARLAGVRHVVAERIERGVATVPVNAAFAYLGKLGFDTTSEVLVETA